MGPVGTLVRLNDERFLDGSLVLGYEDAGCQGSPWLVKKGLPNFDPIVPGLFTHSAVGPDKVLYVPGPTPATPVVSSYRSAFACEAVAPSPAPAFPAVPLIDLGIFVPPFQVR